MANGAARTGGCHQRYAQHCRAEEAWCGDFHQRERTIRFGYGGDKAGNPRGHFFGDTEPIRKPGRQSVRSFGNSVIF